MENWGCIIDERRRFKFMVACGSSMYHSWIGIELLVEKIIATNQF